MLDDMKEIALLINALPNLFLHCLVRIKNMLKSKIFLNFENNPMLRDIAADQSKR